MAVTPAPAKAVAKTSVKASVDKVKKAEAKAPVSKAKLVDRVGLVVNREVATLGEIEEAVVSYYLGEGRRPPTSSTGPEYLKIRKKVIDSMIEEFVLSQEAAAMTIEVSDKEAEKQAESEIESIK
jgi:hypothetical protein